MGLEPDNPAKTPPVYRDVGDFGAAVILRVEGHGYVIFSTPDVEAEPHSVPLLISIITDSEATYGF